MSILGIGVDVVHLPRIASLMVRRRPLKLASRILSPSEFQEWNSQESMRQCQFLAVRWAVKEATYKALYPVVKPMWKELSYRGMGPSRDGAKPSLIYEPNTIDDTKKVGRIHVSVSHDGDYVLASVLVERPERQE